MLDKIAKIVGIILAILEIVKIMPTIFNMVEGFPSTTIIAY